jgi:hypothetical protein
MHKPFPERPALLFDLVFPSRSENFLLNLGIADAHGPTPTFAGLGAQNNAVPCPCDSSLHASRVYRIPMAEALEALVMHVGGNRESSRIIYEAFNMFDVRDAPENRDGKLDRSPGVPQGVPQTQAGSQR